MKSAVTLIGSMRSAILFMLIGCFGVFLYPAEAQRGQNAVYNNTLPTGSVVPSPAFIDASMFANGSDFCGVLNSVLQFLQTNYPSGAVIDARGLPYSTPSTSMTCQASPWVNIASPVPSTILLPAGTIYITKSWILPSGTRVIGEGSINPINITGTVPQTTIEACTGQACSGQSFTDTAMVQLGSSSLCSYPCIGVTLEDVTLNGNGLGISGIVNAYSQDLSYAKNVAIYQVAGVGLQISGNAQNSGPYTNITYDTGTLGGSVSTCASINNVNGGTRGIHGLTCISDSTSIAAIKLASSNNSLEDIRIVGFNQGVVVGSQPPATSNVMKNVWGDTIPLRIIPSPPTVIRIEGGGAVSDLILLGIANPTPGAANTIVDQATNTTLTDPSVAMYALGEPDAHSSGYSRFTTSPNAATWAVGSVTPSSPCSKGSLYSCTASTGCSALSACTSNSGSWTPISAN